MQTCLLTISTVSAALLPAVSAQAQKVPATQVPAAAQVIFRHTFATAKDVRWAKEGASYEVAFTQQGQKMSAVITPAGKLLETETTLPISQLPPAVRTTLARTYKTAKVSEAARLVRADGRTVYEAEIRQGGKQQDVLFTADGQVTK